MELAAASLKEVLISLGQADDSDVTALLSLRSRTSLEETLRNGSVATTWHQ